MIYRINKNKNYSIIHNSVLNEQSLSWKAKGILVYLLSKPDGWEVKERDIVKQGKDGKDAVSSGVKELIKAGYIKRKRWQDEAGHWHWMTDVFETPQPCGKSELGKSDIGKSELGKPAFIVNTELVNTELVNTDIKTVKAKIDESKKLPSLDAEKKDRTPPSCAQPPQDFEAYHQEMMDTLKSGISDANIKAYTTGAMIQMTIPEFWQMVAEMIDHYGDDHGFKKNPTGFIKRKVRGWLSSRKFRRTKTQKAAPKNDLKKGKFFDRPAARAANAAKWEIL